MERSCRLPPGVPLPPGRVEASGPDWCILRGPGGVPEWIPQPDWVALRARHFGHRPLPVGAVIHSRWRPGAPDEYVRVEAVGYDWMVVRPSVGDQELPVEPEYYRVLDWGLFIAALKMPRVVPPYPGIVEEIP